MRLVSCFSAGLTAITVTAAVLVSSPAGEADPQASAGPALEPFVVEKVIDFDFPSGVSQGNAAEITPVGEHLMVEIDTEGGSQVAITDLAGDQYRCVTCGVAKSATKVTALEDGKRIWFAEGSSGGTGKFTYTMLECSPSIYDCKDKKSTPVKFPSGGSLLGGQNREAKPDPHGEYVTWNEVSPIEGTRMSIAKLVPGRDTYELVEQRVFSPAWDKKSDYAADLVDAARCYEGASWHNVDQWSFPAKDFNPFMGRPMPASLLKGKSAGSALLSYVGTYASGTFSVVYKNYSDDGETFIDGFEKMVVVAAPIAATWSAAPKSRGVRKGHLRGLVVVGPDNFYKGKVDSVINGRELAGIPTQANCPTASQPKLTISAASAGLLRVTATLPGDGQARPVRGVVVSTAAATATTDERGIVTLNLAPGAEVTAKAGGFQTATYTVAGN